MFGKSPLPYFVQLKQEHFDGYDRKFSNKVPNENSYTWNERTILRCYTLDTDNQITIIAF